MDDPHRDGVALSIDTNLSSVIHGRNLHIQTALKRLSRIQLGPRGQFPINRNNRALRPAHSLEFAALRRPAGQGVKESGL